MISARIRITSSILTIEMISVPDHLRGNKICSRFIDYLEALSDETGMALMMENVLSPKLSGSFKRRGYIKSRGSLRGTWTWLKPISHAAGNKSQQ